MKCKHCRAFSDLADYRSFAPATPTRTTAKSTAKSTSDQQSSAFEIYAGWEIISEQYETNLEHYVDWMPLICCAGFSTPPNQPKLHDRTQLLRHFSECLIHDIVTHTPYTGGLTRKLSDSLLSTCLFPGKPRNSQADLEQYQQWQVWRDRINQSQVQSPFHLCFQLHAPAKPSEP